MVHVSFAQCVLQTSHVQPIDADEFFGEPLRLLDSNPL
jgi:hypothetical protein